MNNEQYKKAMKVLLARQGWTQADLANHYHVTRATITNWLSNPTDRSTQQILTALNSNDDEFQAEINYKKG